MGVQSSAVPWKIRIGRVGDRHVVHVREVAAGVEGDVVREPGAGRPVQALEPRQRRPQRDGTASRESHDGDSRGIDPRVRGQEFQGPVGIPDRRQVVDLRLVLRGTGDALDP